MLEEDSSDVDLEAPESTCPFCLKAILQEKESFLFVVVCHQCGESQYHESCLEDYARSGKGRRTISGNTRKKEKEQRLWRKLSSGWYCPKGFGKCEKDCNGWIEKYSMAKIKKAPSTPRWPAAPVSQLSETIRSGTPGRRASTPRRRPPPNISLKRGGNENLGKGSSRISERLLSRPPLHGKTKSTKGTPLNMTHKTSRVIEWIAPKLDENRNKDKRRYKSPERCDWAAEEREGWNVVGKKAKSKTQVAEETGVFGRRGSSDDWRKGPSSSKIKWKPSTSRPTKGVEKSKPKLDKKITTLPCGKRKDLSSASRHWTGWGHPTESECAASAASTTEEGGRKWADVVKQIKPSEHHPITRSMSVPRSSRPLEYIISGSSGSTKPSTPLSRRSSGTPPWGFSLEKRTEVNGVRRIENNKSAPRGSILPGSEGKSDTKKTSLWDYHVSRGSEKLRESRGGNSLINEASPWSSLNLGNISGGSKSQTEKATKAPKVKTAAIEIKRPLVINKKKVIEVATGPICVWKANDKKKPPLPSVRISTKKMDGLDQLGGVKRVEGSELGHTPRTTFSKVVVQDVFYPEKTDPIQPSPKTSSSLPRSFRSCVGPEQQEFIFGSFKNDARMPESPFTPAAGHFPKGFNQGEKVGDVVLPPDPLSVPNQTQSRLVAKALVGNDKNGIACTEGSEVGLQNYPIESGMPSLEEIHFPWKNRKANPLRSAVESSSGVLFSEGGDLGSKENSLMGSVGEKFQVNLEEIVSKDMERQSLSAAAPRPFPFPNKWKPPPGLGRDVELDFSDQCQIEAAVNEGLLPRNFRTVFCSSVGFGKCPLGVWCIHAHSHKEFRFHAALQLAKEHPNSRLFPAPPESYKTKLCVDWWGGLESGEGKIGSVVVKGRCCFGEKCCWAHSSSEFRTKSMIDSLKTLPTHYKTKLCDSFMKMGKCPPGPVCMDAHGMEEIRREAAVALRAVPTPELYKLKFCDSVFKGTVCELGHSCAFAHSTGDLRVKAAVRNKFMELSFLGYENPTVLLKAVACPRLYQTHDQCNCNHFHSDKDRLPKLTYSLTLCPTWEEMGKCPYQQDCPFVHDDSELRTGHSGSQIPQFRPLPPDQRVSNRTLALLKYQKLQKCIAYARDNFNYDTMDADRISQYVGGDIDAAYRIYLGLNSGNVCDRLKSVGDVDVTEDIMRLTTIATGGACLEQLITIVTLFEGDVEKALELHNTRAQVMASQMKIEFSMAPRREMF